MERSIITPLIFILSLLMTTVSSASIITNGMPTPGGNAFPFTTGAYDAGGRYQQIYSSELFDSSIIIDSIGFASSTDIEEVDRSVLYDVDIFFSTTSRAPNMFFEDNVDLNAHIGPDVARVFSGLLQTTLDGSSNSVFDLIFPTTNFQYNPDIGNLLVDIVFNADALLLTPGRNTSSFTVIHQSFPPLSGRIFQSFGVGTPAADSTSLYTQFTTVPEPSTLVLLFIGFLLLFYQRRRKQEYMG